MYATTTELHAIASRLGTIDGDLVRVAADEIERLRGAHDKAMPSDRIPIEPTEAMLNAARDWSHAKYGKPIGNDAARGCWAAMLAACEGRE